jgi:thioredoxin reductase (NADPH)
MIDLAIVGAGAAGLTAAVYAARAGLDFVLLEQDGYGGGQIASAHQVENYPGAGSLSGEALGEAFRQQALALGADIRLGTVERAADQGSYKTLYLDDGEAIETRAVLAATGSVPKTLDVPGEAELIGSGVSYCALCDGAFFQNRPVLVVGGGDTAVEDGLYLSALCSHVTVALRSNRFRGAKRRVELLQKKENVTVLENTTVSAIHGTESVTSVTLLHQGQEQSYPVDGVFVAVGTVPVGNWLADLHPTMEGGFVKADESGVTDVPGLFVAGDLRQKPLRQVITAAADGANAVTSAVQWLQNI